MQPKIQTHKTNEIICSGPNAENTGHQQQWENGILPEMKENKKKKNEKMITEPYHLCVVVQHVICKVGTK